MNVDNIEDIYELTPLQQGMLYHTLYAPQSGTYFEQFSYQLEGAINSVAMRVAWQRVLDATPVLRSAIVWEEIATPVQVVYQHIELPWSEEDWRDIAPEQQKARLDAWLLEDRQRGFELTQAPLLRLALIRCGEQSYHLVWSFHHILLDGWSVALLLAEVLHAYTALYQKGELYLQPRRAFRDYIVWLQERNQQAAESYWKNMLAGFDAPTSLGIGTPRPVVPSVDVTVSEQKLLLPLAVTRELEDMARERQVTLNTLMQGMWALLLSRYSGERRVIFGVTVAGRPPELEGVERMIGMFINTLPLVIEVGGEQRLDEWLQGVQASNVGLRQYEQTPLVQVQEWSQVPRGQPLFESLLVFENYPEEVTTHLQNVSEATLHSPTTFERTNYPITLVALPGKQLRLSVSYERERFEDETIERLLDHCQQILRQMLAQPGSRLVQLSLLTQAERQQVLSDWNQTSRDYPRQSNVPALFQAQVARTPDRIALCLQDACLTYAELNARANQLARYLQRLGVGPEVPVGLYLHRCVELPLSILAILKAGGVYVPLDLNAPASRLAFLQADTGFSLLISQPEHLARLASLPVQPLLLKEHWTRINACPAHELRTDGQAEHLAYIMYTSGSTGLPKGTGVSHRNVLRLVLNT